MLYKTVLYLNTLNTYNVEVYFMAIEVTDIIEPLKIYVFIGFLEMNRINRHMIFV